MSEFDLDYELELERELEAEEPQQMPPEDIDPVEAASASQTHATQPTMPMLMRSGPLERLLRNVRGWEKVEVQNQQNPDFMPPIGCMAVDGRTRFQPKPKTALSAGNVLACVAEMGRGKSTMIREYQRSTITRQAHALAQQAWHNPSARFLLLTANRMYAASAGREQEALAAELCGLGSTAVVAGSYMSSDGDHLAACQFVLCSLESLHHVESQRFDVVVIDEVGSIARLVGGGTMQELSNVWLLRSLCGQMGTRVVALDADLLFKMDSTEPSTVVEDFFKLVMPERNVLCAQLAGQKPPHLQRSVRLYFDHSQCDGQAGKADWMAGIETLVDRWHTTQGESGLIIIAVGSKVFGRKVCQRLVALKAPHKFYHGDSNQRERFEHFSDLRAHAQGLCAIVVTTVLAIGVNIPQDITVAQVFAAFCRMGCAFQQLCQALLRARHVQDPEIRVLVDCMPPNVRDMLVQQGKKKKINRPTYDDAQKAVTRRRATGMRFYESMLRAGGGLPAGVTPLKLLDDDALRVMAHPRFERSMQISDPFYAMTKLFEHHGWGTQLGFAQQAEAQFDLSELAALTLSDDHEFDILRTDLEKWGWVVAQIFERGEDGFFDNCYGLATKQMASSNALSQGDQWLVKAFWALRNIGFVPALDEFGDPPTGDDGGDGGEGGEGGEVIEAPPTAVLLKAWLGNGSDHNNLTPHLKLHAYCRLFTPEEAMKRDFVNGLNSGKRKRDPQLELHIGSKLEVVAQVGRLLLEGGYRRPAQLVDDEVILAQRFVDLANRCIRKETTESDNNTLKQLRQTKEYLGVGGKDSTLQEVLRANAKAIGMKLVEVKQKVTLPDGTRKLLVQSMKLVRLLPEVSDAWLVYSDVLGTEVQVNSWVSAHANAKFNAMEASFSTDPDYGNLFTAPFQGQDSDGMRWEKINAAELTTALTRLRHVRNTLDGQTLTPKIEHELRELNTLEAIGQNAEPVDQDGIRRLCVVYGKRSILGRRTASYPSMQACPSSLRPLLLKLYYHDIDIVNCHPTLMIQVCSKFGKRHLIPTLVNYEADRDVVLQRIADHFGVDKASCKFVVLRVLNGGSVQKWIEDVGLPANTDTDQPDLRDLAEEARVIRACFFEYMEQKQQGTVEHLRELARVRKGASASNAAIDRAAFSACMFEVEDSVLTVVDEYFRSMGWVVASLIYDGMHVEHRDGDAQDPQTGRWLRIEEAMRAAEAAVERKLGYKIDLKEKPLFEKPLVEAEEEIEYAEESGDDAQM
jgi:hypothetical protein